MDGESISEKGDVIQKDMINEVTWLGWQASYVTLRREMFLRILEAQKKDVAS